jgi:hypothetical protein
VATLIEPEHHRHPVSASEDVGALRRAVSAMAATLPDLRPGEAELVATELGTNLLNHAVPGGYVLYRKTGGGIEFLSVDAGPGMANPSAGGGLGAGLAGIQRMASDYDCYSTSTGSVVFACIGSSNKAGESRWRFGGVDIPLGGSGASGDGWVVAAEGQLAAMVVDGLGHGDDAALAARAAISAFAQRQVTDVAELLERAHDAMHGTRGGVAAACLVDAEAGQATFAGVGNISGQILCVQEKRQHLLSRPGTLGTQVRIPSVHIQHHRWAPGATMVMVSDGVRSGWDLSAYPGLLDHHPSVVAAVLHRDFTRPNDDATVLVAQEVTWRSPSVESDDGRADHSRAQHPGRSGGPASPT